MPALIQTFIDALGRLENARDVEAVAGLFAEHAKISNPVVLYEEGSQRRRRPSGRSIATPSM